MIRDYPFVSVAPSGLVRPYLAITIVNPHAGIRRKVIALIDTGADECALPAAFAPILGHDLTAGQVKQVGTGNGTTVAYAHTVGIEVASFRTGDVLIDFMPNLTMPLIGVRSFLSKFVLRIDYPARRFSLELP